MDLNSLVRGQSNAELLALNFGGSAKLKQAVEALLGFDGVQNQVHILAGPLSASDNSATTIQGATGFLGDWLKAVNGDWRQGWTTGTVEQRLLNYVQGLSADLRDNPTTVLWLHNETDSLTLQHDIQNGSLTTASAAAMWESAVRYDAALLRAAFGNSALDMPYDFVSAIPYRSYAPDGLQAIRAVMEKLAADAGFNATIAARALDLDMSFDNLDANAATAEYGGGHMSAGDAALVIQRAALSIAEGWSEYALAGSPVARALGNIDNEGPEVIWARRIGASSLTVDVQHDGAHAFAALGGAAASGLGWAVRLADGTSIAATHATVVDGDTLRLDFASDLPLTGGTLHYGWGYGRLADGSGPGQGNAVYDDQGLPVWTPATGVAVATGALQALSVTQDAAGRNVAALHATGLREVQVSDASGGVTILHGSTAYHAAALDVVALTDGRLVFDVDDAAAQVVRLYKAALNRAPDPGGLQHHIAFLAAGGSLETLAHNFLASAEFQAGGATGAAGSLARIESNVYGTASARIASLSAFSSEGLEQALISISEGRENRANTAGQIEAGIWIPDQTAVPIARLYDAAFGRLPDRGGLENWVAAVKGQKFTFAQLPDLWLTTPEWNAVHGQQSDEAFVSGLYHTALHREPDAGGYAHFLSLLETHSLSRGGVLLAMSESVEHQMLTKANTGSDGVHSGIAFV